MWRLLFFNPAIIYRSGCTKPGKWAVKYLCTRTMYCLFLRPWYLSLQLFGQCGIFCWSFYEWRRRTWIWMLVFNATFSNISLYHGDQFSGGGSGNTDPGQAIGKLYHLQLRVECTQFFKLPSWARTHAVLVIGLKETSFEYSYNYKHNQYFTCSSNCIYICLHNLYICQIIFPSFTDIYVTRIAIVLIKKKKIKKK